MIRKTALLLTLLVFSGSFLLAQLSPYKTYLQLYQDAVELYEKETYAAAQRKVEDFLIAEAEIRGNRNNDVHANALFIRAASAFHLKRDDAVILLSEFTSTYPENTKAELARYLLGKYYFEQRAYKKAIELLQQAYDSYSLPSNRQDELNFYLGYSYYVLSESDVQLLPQAERYLANASSRPSDYQEKAQYYYALLLYREENFDQAYFQLKELQDVPEYQNETRILLAYCMLELGYYQELFDLAETLKFENKGRRNDAEVFAIAANASYEQNNFIKSIEYFQAYDQSASNLDRTSSFRYGYAHYKQSQFQQAIPIFQRVLTVEDSLTQVASYYLGFCFLKVGDPESAKFAFYKASQRLGAFSYSNLQEEALFQYAKVAFATRDYSEALRALRELTDRNLYPNFVHYQEAQSLIGEILFYSKNYEEAIRYFEQSGNITDSRARQAYQKACYYYGLDLINQNDFPRADMFFQKAVNINADQDLTLSSQYWLAESLFRQERYDQSRTAFMNYKRYPGSSTHRYAPLADYGIAWSHFKEKSYNVAYQFFDQFIRNAGARPPKRPFVDAYLRAGDCLFLTKQYALSEDYYARVLELNYGFQDYAHYQSGESQFNQRRYQTAINSFRTIVDRYGNSELKDDALNRISEIYATNLKDYRAAGQYAQQLVRESPQSPLAAGAYNRLALSAYNSGNEAAAVNYFKKVLEDYSSDRRNSQIALDNLASLLNPAEFDRVLRNYRRRNPELDESLAELTFNTGRDRFYSGNFNAAIGQLSTYIRDFKNGPNYQEALLFRARAYKEIGELRNSFTDYQEAYNNKVFNNFSEVALLEAAQLHLDQVQYNESLQLFQRLDNQSQSAQTRTEAKFGMIESYKAMNNLQAAKQVLGQISNDPEISEATRTKARLEIGIADYNLGNLVQAKQVFADIEREFNNEYAAQAQYFITQITFDQGRYEEAYEAGVYMKNNYPSYNYWKARTFLVVAEANYRLGEIFQAKGTLQSLVDQTRGSFPDVFEQASRRLAEIEREEQRQQQNQFNPNSGGNN